MSRDPDNQSATQSVSHGPGPFLTRRVLRLGANRHRVATSRRHRKGLPAHEVASLVDATKAPVTSRAAFRHLFAPRRLGWWIAVSFAIGSLHFLVGALASAWPHDAPELLRDPRLVGWVFFLGSVFFTTAAWLQWLEALNGDVATAFEPEHASWRWFGWCPRNLGYLACTVQLVGTLLFNFNTADALVSALSWVERDLVIWVPDMLGSVCFLLASYLAYAEVSHGVASFEPRNVSWWIAIVNLAGSVAFQLSASIAFAGPSPAASERIFWSTVWTAIGALGFLSGAYLMIPELFDVPAQESGAVAR